MEKKTSTRKKTVKNELKKTLPTLLQAIERVVELSRNSKMSDEFMLEASPEIGLLANSYGITERQAVLFCICMERGPRRVDYDDLASHLDMNKISVLGYAADIDALVRRRLLKFRDVKDEDREYKTSGERLHLPTGHRACGGAADDLEYAGGGHASSSAGD